MISAVASMRLADHHAGGNDHGEHPGMTDLFERAIEAGDVPGVVSRPRQPRTGQSSQGASARATCVGHADDGRHCGVDRLDDQGGHRCLRHAACGTGQTVARCADRDGAAAARRRQVLEGFAPDGAPRLRPAKRPITLRHLLTHSQASSMRYGTPQMARYMETTGTPGIISAPTRRYRSHWYSIPGERWDYGIGIDWAGKAVEAVSGRRSASTCDSTCLGRSA